MTEIQIREDQNPKFPSGTKVNLDLANKCNVGTVARADLMRFGRYSFRSMEIWLRFVNIGRVRVRLTEFLAEFEYI